MSSAPQANLKHLPLYIELIAENHPFYTCGDLVRGVVRAEPTFRPSRINISFKGFSLIYDQNANGATPNFFQYSQDLFVSTGAHENFDILRRGTAEDGKVELPFEFTFPHTVWLAPPSDRTWWYSKDSYHHPRFQHSPGFLLPPSCTSLVSANGPLAPKITYILEACMNTTTPDSPRMKVHQELKFVPPAPEYDLALRQPNLDLGTKLPKHSCRYKFIRTRKLLPGYQGSSKLGKVRDILVDKELFFGLNSYTEVPYARFNLLAIPARVLVIGSPIPITVSVQHLDRSASLPGPPDLFMRRVRVQLLPTFNIFIPRLAHGRDAGKETVDVTRDTFTLFDKKFEEDNGAPLLDGLKLADIGDIKLTHEKVLPSFTSYGLCLEYELQVEIWGECAGREFSGIACRDQVQVVSGWNVISSQDHVAEGSVSVPQADLRPVYQELDPMATHVELGSRERFGVDDRAPGYEFAPPPPIQDLGSRPLVPLLNPRSMPPPYMA